MGNTKQRKCRSSSRPLRARQSPSRLSPLTPSRTSRPRSRTRRASPRTSRGRSSLASSLRTAGPSPTTTSRRSPLSTLSSVLGEVCRSSSRPSPARPSPLRSSPPTPSRTQGGRNQVNLSGWRKVSVNIVDLFLESFVQHFIGLVQNEHFDASSTQSSASNHVKNAARGSRYNMLTIVKFSNIFTEIGTTNASMALNIHVISKGQNNLLNLHCQFSSW